MTLGLFCVMFRMQTGPRESSIGRNKRRFQACSHRSKHSEFQCDVLLYLSLVACIDPLIVSTDVHQDAYLLRATGTLWKYYIHVHK